MSIINEALKKVQSDIEKNTLATPIKAPPPSMGRDDAPSVLPSPRIVKSLLNSDTILPPGSFRTTGVHKSPKLSQSQQGSGAPSILATALTVRDQKKSDRILIVLCGLICALLIFSICYLFYLFGETHTKDAPSKSRQGTRSHALHEIVIQGIVAKGDKNVALINDEIYEEGQTFRGKRIVEITLDSVKISDRGKIKTLRVQVNKGDSHFYRHR